MRSCGTAPARESQDHHLLPIASGTSFQVPTPLSLSHCDTVTVTGSVLYYCSGMVTFVQREWPSRPFCSHSAVITLIMTDEHAFLCLGWRW